MKTLATILFNAAVSIVVCYSQTFSDTIWIKNHGVPVSAGTVQHLFDPDSIVIKASLLPQLRNQMVEFRLSSRVQADDLVAALRHLRHISYLHVTWAGAGLIDSVLSIVEFDSLEGLGIYVNDAVAMPRHLRRFPNVKSFSYGSLAFVSTHAYKLAFPCSILTDLPHLMQVSIQGVIGAVECACNKSDNIIELQQWDMPMSLNLDEMFITSGLYTQFNCLYDVFELGTRSLYLGRFESRKAPAVPTFGHRSYVVHRSDTVRHARFQGVLDRFIATLFAYAISGENVFTSKPDNSQERFISYALNADLVCDVEISDDRITLYNGLIYTGPLVPLMNRLLNETCY